MNKQRKEGILLLLIVYFPVLSVLLILPFIMRLTFVSTDLYQYPWFPDLRNTADIFLYVRSRCFTGIAAGAAVLLGIFYVTGTGGIKLSKARQFIPLGIYLFFSILSAVMSEYPEAVFKGTIDQFESIYSVIGYCVLAFYACTAVTMMQNTRLLTGALAAGAAGLSVIGIGQFLGYDLYSSNPGRLLIVPEQYASYRQLLDFQFAQSSLNRVYMSLYNPNYAGVYAVLVLPVVLAAAWKEKGRAARLVLLIVCAGLFAACLMSGSKTAVLVLGIVLALHFFMQYKNKRLWNKKTVFALAAAAVMFLVYDAALGNTYFSAIRKALFAGQTDYRITDITIRPGEIKINYKDKLLYLGFDDEGSISARDEAKSPVLFTGHKGVYKTEDRRFLKLRIRVSEQSGRLALTVQNKWDFIYDKETDCFTYYTANKKADELKRAPAVGFKGYEKIFTKRGYIWSRTFPLLKQYMLTGSGADTFVYVFPQDDYVMKQNLNFGNTVITRPHNMYIQTWVQSGFIALLAVLVFIVSYGADCIRLYWGRGDERAVGYGIFLGCTGYMTAMLANDSMPVTAPLFWTLLGAGIGINTIYKQKKG